MLLGARRELEAMRVEQLREQRLATLEAEKGLPAGDLQPFPIEEINVSSEGQKMAAILSMLVPMLLLVCMVMAGHASQGHGLGGQSPQCSDGLISIL